MREKGGFKANTQTGVWSRDKHTTGSGYFISRLQLTMVFICDCSGLSESTLFLSCSFWVWNDLGWGSSPLLPGEVLIQEFSLSLWRFGSIGRERGLGAGWNCLKFFLTAFLKVLLLDHLYQKLFVRIQIPRLASQFPREGLRKLLH